MCVKAQDPRRTKLTMNWKRETENWGRGTKNGKRRAGKGEEKYRTGNGELRTEYVSEDFNIQPYLWNSSTRSRG